MSSQCVFADFADRREGKGAGVGEILHRLSADDYVGVDLNPTAGRQGVQCGGLRLLRVRGVPVAGEAQGVAAPQIKLGSICRFAQ